MMPDKETLNAAAFDCLTTERSVSMPVNSNSIKMPSCEMASIMLCCVPSAENTSDRAAPASILEEIEAVSARVAVLEARAVETR